MLLPLIINPNKILRTKSKAIEIDTIKTKEFQKLCQDMIETMITDDGVGLAAPQIGKNIRLITINFEDGPVCMINPEITKKSWAKEWEQEGCLSVPETFGEVQRHKKVNYIYTDINGNKIKAKAENLMARAIQHEIDHLNGILYIDKAKNIQKIKA